MKNKKALLKRALGYIFKYKLSVIVILLMSIFEALITVFSPKIAGKGITALSMTDSLGRPNIDLDYVFKLLAFLLVLYSLNGLFSCIGKFLFKDISVRIVRQLRKEISKKMNVVSFEFLQKKPKGEVISCMLNDVNALGSVFIESTRSLISSVIIFFGTVYMMLSLSVEISLWCFAFFPFMIALILFITVKSQKYYVSYRKNFAKMSSCAEEAFSGYETVKVLKAESGFKRNFDLTNEDLREDAFKSETMSGLMGPIMTFISKALYVVCCAVGGYFSVVKGFAIGDITAFIAYSGQFMNPFMELAGISGNFQSAFAAAQRIFEFLDAPEEKSGGEKPDFKGAGIEFKNVSFEYETGKEVIKDLSFKILPGQTAAIVGETGGGKTTVSRLLLRLYESYSGEILVGNKNIKDFDINAYRGLFGVVTQDSWLFSASVIENIRYGNTKVSDDEIKFACEELGAASFIEALPEGYNTILKEGIDNISEGQKQLLCIARALVSNREILVLDEATASVDVFTESKVQTALKTLLKGRTSVVIAHRLSTIKEADVIFVLEKGKLAECGKHEDLISKRGIYYEMYSKS